MKNNLETQISRYEGRFYAVFANSSIIFAHDS